MFYHLIKDDIHTLNEISKKILREYPNIRFLFEIDFTKDDYLLLKECFLTESLLSRDIITKGYFQRYFRNYSSHRIPFLLLVVGFIRYEYLNCENPGNFFSNFLLNALKNKITSPNDFRQELIDYFFRWRGSDLFEKEGLYIYETQTQGVSLKLEDAGKNRFLNSFILHSGGISEKDLQEYLKIIDDLIDHMDDSLEIDKSYLYHRISDNHIYSSRLKNFFTLLKSENEVSGFVEQIIYKSIKCIDKSIEIQGINKLFDLPLYLKNYLRFVGKYGEGLSSYSINISDFYFKEGNFYFVPRYIDEFHKVNRIAFVINNKIVERQNEEKGYTKELFEKESFLIEKVLDPFSVDILIDDELFERLQIDLFKNNILLLNEDLTVRGTINNSISINQKEERDGVFYVLSTEKIKLPVQDEYILDQQQVYLYRMMINRLRRELKVNDRKINIYFQPNLASEYVYQDSSGFKYYDELPRFDIENRRDIDKFKAIDFLNDVELNFNEYINYKEEIGKFRVELLNRNYDMIYIKGFEIIQWPEWYGHEKEAKIFIGSDRIQTNYDERDEQRDGNIYTYRLDNSIKDVWFRMDEDLSIEFPIKKPVIEIYLIKSDGSRSAVKSRNIDIKRLAFFSSISVRLLNYPTNINFNSLQVGNEYIPIKKIDNEYIIPIKDILPICEEIPSHCLLKLRQNYIYQNLFHLIKVDDANSYDLSLKEHGVREIVNVKSLDFIKENIDDVKYYILNNNKRVPFYVSDIITEDIGGFIIDLVEFHEVRKTKKNTVIKKPFKTILKDGVYVDAEFITL